VRPAGVPGRFGTAGDFDIRVGTRIDVDTPRGYHLDFRVKAPEPDWPPPWFGHPAHRMHVVPIQWALGCYEHFVESQDEAWLAAATAAGDWLVDEQCDHGAQTGGWVKDFPYKHTYPLAPPWLSGMAQGQGASLLVRLYLQTREERYREAAVKAIRPMRSTAYEGGVAARIQGGFFPEEYPTDPPSHVLNGGIFGLWGCFDVAAALGDTDARSLADEGFRTLAEALHLYDTGSWSLYDLYPHPVPNIAHGTYHRLHIAQLEATARLHPDPRFAEFAGRFEGYQRSRLRRIAAFGRKALFRVAVPRNQRLARRLPWARAPAS
jgi:heparosan-N-sulfate-glucuronate 5-epimerase